jgi:predicted dithiol-disulfide oxidoreductase (DUF899 family)
MAKSTKASSIEKQIHQAEKKVQEAKEKLTKLRKKLPREEFKDYSFKTSKGKSVSLSGLFGRKSELILIHNMGSDCPYCTLWADGFNGVLEHLTNRAAFAVESADLPEVQKRLAKTRNWKFNFVSSAGTKFKFEAGFGDADGSPWPGVSVFTKDAKGKIHRVSHTIFGPGDSYCSTWDLFDLLPKGPDDWEPRLKY